MIRTPEAAFATFVAACFLTAGLAISGTEPRAADAAIVSGEDRRGARVTPVVDLAMTVQPATQAMRRGARVLVAYASTTAPQAADALTGTPVRHRRGG
ncbi:hypothetical protein AB0T83_04460 [Fluviibacterium sp. DFM31]|uniref:SAF domain-containing protein n=1 Tax=Meridianimarinicoccus marinus TaxID=3231483 RepID=A0ABV3L3A9_9RHOB